MLNIFFLLLGSLYLFTFLYLIFLAIVSLLPEKKRTVTAAPANRFAIIIPAYNEALILEKTICALNKVDYPLNMYNIYVIADNCTDDTAAVARKKGVIVLERNESGAKGKGAVLRWAFDILLKEDAHDVYVIVDADTHVEKDFLLRINQRFHDGAMAVQAYSNIIYPERSPQESLSYLGFVLNRNLRYRGRSRLGWNANLMGTGMCFRKEIIEKYGWYTETNVEDVEYMMILQLNGIQVQHAHEAKIWVQLHKTFGKTISQRRRWDMGKFTVRNRYCLKLISAGLRSRDFSYFDSALELDSTLYAVCGHGAGQLSSLSAFFL